MKWYDFFGDDMNKYPFQITDEILNKVAEISHLVGKVSVNLSLSSNPTLRRTNRINTIYSSLAIEQNTLSIDQVTAVISLITESVNLLLTMIAVMRSRLQLIKQAMR